MVDKLLIQEPPLQVLPSLAILIGLNEAIVLQQIHYLMRISDHVYNGQKWVCLTFEEWACRHFVFWSVATIKRVFNRLEKQKFILSTNAFNANGFDRSKWYSIDYGQLDEFVIKEAQVPEITPKYQLDTMVVSNSYDGRFNLIRSNKEEDYLRKKKTTTKKNGVAVSPGNETTKEAERDKTVPDAYQKAINTKQDQPNITGIMKKLDNSPLKGLISSGAIRKAIAEYDTEAHQKYKPESPCEGVSRLVDWIIAIAQDPNSRPFTNPPGFLIARSREGMDKPAVIFRQETVKRPPMHDVTGTQKYSVLDKLVHEFRKKYQHVGDMEVILNSIDGLESCGWPSPEQMRLIEERLLLAEKRSYDLAHEAIRKITNS